MKGILGGITFAAFLIGGWAGWTGHVNGWTVKETLLHIAAVPNCSVAASLGLAPSRRGEPGYYKRHDKDRDGTSCEAFLRT